MSEHEPLSRIAREFYELHTGEDVPRELVESYNMGTPLQGPEDGTSRNVHPADG